MLRASVGRLIRLEDLLVGPVYSLEALRSYRSPNLGLFHSMEDTRRFDPGQAHYQINNLLLASKRIGEPCSHS